MTRDGLPRGVGVWGHLDSLRHDELRSYAVDVEALGYSALWVPDVVGREPFALAALIAAATERIAVGTSIASIWARSAHTTRAAAMTVQEASRGRFVLGLGVSHRHMTARLHAEQYERPLERMREFLGAYRDAKYVAPRDPDLPEPPVVLAALRRRMLELAARETNGSFAYLVTVERIAWMRETLDSAAGSAGRPYLATTVPVAPAADPEGAHAVARAYLTPYLRTPNYQRSWAEQGFGDGDWQNPGSDALVEAMVALGPETAAARIEELREAGADHVALIPLGSDGSTEHVPTLQALSPASVPLDPG